MTVSDKFDQENIIFVGGAPRSGTTLVQRILSAHSLIYGGPEFDLLPEIVKLRNIFLEKIEAGRIDSYLNNDEADEVIRQFVMAIFRKKIGRENNKKYISEKTPFNITVFPELIRIFPRSHFIFVMRDPRAIVASLMEVGMKYRRDKREPPEFARNTLFAIEHINEFWARGGQTLASSDRVHVVYYEDVVLSPEATIRGLMQNIGLPYEVQITNIKDKKMDIAGYKTGEQYWYTVDQLQKGIEDGSLEKWKSILTGYDLYLISKYIGRLPGITDRYRFNSERKLQWFVRGFMEAQMIRLRNKVLDIGRKIGRHI